MRFFYVLFTAVMVSVDSFLVGFSLSVSTRKGLLLPLTVAFVTLLLCVIAATLGELVKNLLQSYARFVSAAILIFLGVMSLLTQDEFSIAQASPVKCLLVGLGVGLDGAAATFSLVIQKMGDLVWTPLIFALMHFVAVLAGQRLATKSSPAVKSFSAAIFFALALMKLLNV